eukprot:jgi/Mesvir1/22367/Mv26588-RA.1
MGGAAMGRRGGGDAVHIKVDTGRDGHSNRDGRSNKDGGVGQNRDQGDSQDMDGGAVGGGGGRVVRSSARKVNGAVGRNVPGGSSYGGYWLDSRGEGSADTGKGGGSGNRRGGNEGRGRNVGVVDFGGGGAVLNHGDASGGGDAVRMSDGTAGSGGDGSGGGRLQPRGGRQKINDVGGRGLDGEGTGGGGGPDGSSGRGRTGGAAPARSAASSTATSRAGRGGGGRTDASLGGNLRGRGANSGEDEEYGSGGGQDGDDAFLGGEGDDEARCGRALCARCSRELSNEELLGGDGDLPAEGTGTAGGGGGQKRGSGRPAAGREGGSQGGRAPLPTGKKGVGSKGAGASGIAGGPGKGNSSSEGMGGKLSGEARRRGSNLMRHSWHASSGGSASGGEWEEDDTGDGVGGAGASSSLFPGGDESGDPSPGKLSPRVRVPRGSNGEEGDRSSLARLRRSSGGLGEGAGGDGDRLAKSKVVYDVPGSLVVETLFPSQVDGLVVHSKLLRDAMKKYGNKSCNRTLQWVLHHVDAIYKEKMDRDSICDRDGVQRLSLPDAMFAYLRSQYGTKALVDEHAGNIMASTLKYEGGCLKLRLFRQLLCEEWDARVCHAYLAATKMLDAQLPVDCVEYPREAATFKEASEGWVCGLKAAHIVDVVRGMTSEETHKRFMEALQRESTRANDADVKRFYNVSGQVYDMASLSLYKIPRTLFLARLCEECCRMDKVYQDHIPKLFETCQSGPKRLVQKAQVVKMLTDVGVDETATPALAAKLWGVALGSLAGDDRELFAAMQADEEFAINQSAFTTMMMDPTLTSLPREFVRINHTPPCELAPIVQEEPAIEENPANVLLFAAVVGRHVRKEAARLLSFLKATGARERHLSAMLESLKASLAPDASSNNNVNSNSKSVIAGSNASPGAQNSGSSVGTGGGGGGGGSNTNSNSGSNNTSTGGSGAAAAAGGGSSTAVTTGGAGTGAGAAGTDISRSGYVLLSNYVRVLQGFLGAYVETFLCNVGSQRADCSRVLSVIENAVKVLYGKDYVVYNMANPAEVVLTHTGEPVMVGKLSASVQQQSNFQAAKIIQGIWRRRRRSAALPAAAAVQLLTGSNAQPTEEAK